jgi:sortase A
MSVGAKHAAPSRGPDWRTVARWFGFACLVAASFLGGYVAWLLWGTGITTQRAQDELRPGIEQQIANQRSPSASRPIVPGSAYAVIEIPRIGLNMVVVQGIDTASLEAGPGHYPDTADPWDPTGRVGIAGHRTTYLHPFLDLNQVQRGDQITLLTAYGTYTYAVTRNFVLPADGSGIVLTQTKNPSLVLTTCNPRYSSSQRLIVEAARVRAPVRVSSAA